MKFRCTYWPGTADQPHDYVQWLIETGRINNYAKVKFLEFDSYKDARDLTAARWISTSDGCLIEHVKTCIDCQQEFYTRDEHAIRCPEDEELLTLA